LIILTNPVDIITYLAEKKYSSTNPNAKRIVFGLGTYIDTLRLKSRLKEKLGLKEEIYLPIIGEHGDSMVAVLSQAKIKGKSWPELPQSTKEIVLKAIEEVLSLGSYLIKSKGGANFGVAKAICDIVMILLKKGEKKCLPISSSLGNTTYDLDNELAISLPVILSERGIEKVVKFKLSEEENFKLKKSAQIIKATLEKIKLN
jgi:malate/lactate dehydrogenase